jgi:hypothetical protein
MRFRLDAGFNAKEVELSVTYLDKGTGSWSIGLPGKEGATRIHKTNSGEWKTQTVTCSELTEFRLNHESGDDTNFHLIEVARVK